MGKIEDELWAFEVVDKPEHVLVGDVGWALVLLVGDMAKVDLVSDFEEVKVGEVACGDFEWEKADVDLTMDLEDVGIDFEVVRADFDEILDVEDVRGFEVVLVVCCDFTTDLINVVDFTVVTVDILAPTGLGFVAFFSYLCSETGLHFPSHSTRSCFLALKRLCFRVKIPPHQRPPRMGSAMPAAIPTDPPIAPPIVRDLLKTVLTGMFESSSIGIRGIGTSAGRFVAIFEKVSSNALACLIRSAFRGRFG